MRFRKFRILIRNLRVLATFDFRFFQNYKDARVTNSVLGKPCWLGDFAVVRDSALSAYTNLAHHADLYNVRVGTRTSIGRYTIIRNAELGKYCAISWNVTIGADQHPTERISGSAAFFQKRFELVDKDTSKGNVAKCYIGNDVLIGAGSIVKAGVTIGDGAIIGAGSVVVKDVEPYSVVGGNPARVLKFRFAPEMVSKLQEIKWWDMADRDIKRNIALFQKPLNHDILNLLLTKNI